MEKKIKTLEEFEKKVKDLEDDVKYYKNKKVSEY